MAWDGVWFLGGSEAINAERTEAYLAYAGAPWFRPQFNTNAISTIQGETYVDPVSDPAPWYDERDPATGEFWGVYPLNITGVSDSTRASTTTENVNDGGITSPLRYGTRSMVFEVMLSGRTECAVEAGFRWLKKVLGEGICGSGDDLCYLACEPCPPAYCEGGISDCTDENARTLYEVRVVSGPTITARRKATDGSYIWTATFTATAGNPFEYGTEQDLIQGFMASADPWVPAVVPSDWAFEDSGTLYEDEDCALPDYLPLVDPLCPAVAVPPGPPGVPLGCYEPPEAWMRRWFTLPMEYIPYWGDVVPVIRVQAPVDAVRNIRLRFYADANGDGSILDDPCAYCGDILISYVPGSSTLVFDGVSQTVYVESAGDDVRRADSFVYKTDGTPFDWPILTCGFSYIVAVDIPSDSTADLPGVDVALVPRVAA